MSDLEQTVSEETPVAVVEVPKVKSLQEVAAEAKQARKAAKRLANMEAMLAGPQASKELVEEEEEPEPKQPTPWDLANLRRIEEQETRGGSHSAVLGKTVECSQPGEDNNQPTKPIKRHSIKDAMGRVRWLTENGGTNRQMRRAQAKVDRVILAEENRKDREAA